MAVMLALKALTIDLDIQPRSKPLDAAHAAEMAEYLRANSRKDLPPADVFRLPDGRHLLAHGFHRAEGYARAGRSKLPVTIHEGDETAAALFACAANKDQNALRRTNEDKRRAVIRVLELAPEWTNRRIADHVGVSHDFVATMRDQLASDANTETRKGADGKSYKATKNKKSQGTSVDSTAADPETADEPDSQSGDSAEPDAIVGTAVPTDAPAPTVAVPTWTDWRDAPVEAFLSGSLANVVGRRGGARTAGQIAEMLDVGITFALDAGLLAEVRAGLASIRPAADVPPEARPTRGRKAVDAAERFLEIERLLRQADGLIADLAGSPEGEYLRRTTFGETPFLVAVDRNTGGVVRRDMRCGKLRAVRRAVRRAAPDAVCGGCGGEGLADRGDCRACGGAGFLPADKAFRPDMGQTADLYDGSEPWEV